MLKLLAIPLPQFPVCLDYRCHIPYLSRLRILKVASYLKIILLDPQLFSTIVANNSNVEVLAQGEYGYFVLKEHLTYKVKHIMPKSVLKKLYLAS